MDQLEALRQREGDPEENELFDSPGTHAEEHRGAARASRTGAYGTGAGVWPDLRHCPACGQADFPLAALERVEAFAPVEIAGDARAGFTARWGGTSEVNWDTSLTLAYACRACGSELPEPHAVALDYLLTNRRARGE